MTDRAVVHFDHHDPEFHRRRHREWSELRRCPVAHNPRYGGFWVISGYDEVAAVARDTETFSSRYPSRPDDDIAFLGIAGIPRGPIPTAGIAEVQHLDRALAFADRAVVLDSGELVWEGPSDDLDRDRAAAFLDGP